MAIIFFGTPQFAVPSLQALIDEKEEISLVVTQPDRPKGRGHIISPPPVKELALVHNIPVIQPTKIRDENLFKTLKSYNPEFIVVVAYGRILPDEILCIPKYYCVNVHASLLPKYRGAAPIQWALINGEKKTGVTTMVVTRELDSGDILLQAELEIDDDDNSETLFNKLSLLGAETLIKTLKGIRENTIKPIPQHGVATYAPPLKKEDGRIDWHKSSEELFNFIRGMYPWPSAYCFFGNDRIKIIKARALKGDGYPGRVEKASQGILIVGTGNGLLQIEVLQPDGKPPMSSSAFLAGRKIKEKYDKFS